MDQLKVILTHVQKHHFWLLCVATMIAGMVGWFMARNSLSAAYTKNKADIVAKFTALQGILAIEHHPNSEWTKEIGKLTGKEREIVRNAWTAVYDEQKKHLEWPPELGEEFLNFVNKQPHTAEIREDLCRKYQDLIIKTEFPRLLEIVDAEAHNAKKASPEAVDRKRPGAAKAEEPQHEYKVVWDASSQQEVEKSLYFEQVPSSEQVRQAQEDIWAYWALLTIIRAMNEERYIASVRRISEISIGQRAAAQFQAGMTGEHVEHLKAVAPTAAEGPAPPALPPDGEAVVKPIDEGRYLDPEGKPLPPGEAASKQFKRMPIFLRLAIDQREINKLLVECANSSLPVEVRQLRIAATKSGGGTSVTRQPSSTTNRGTEQGPPTESESYEVPIELAGIIYIYNPPDAAKLGGQPAASSAGGQ